jgi:Fe2+ transport system protein B
MNCLACKLPVNELEMLKCVLCNGIYDHHCLGMTSSYYNGKIEELKHLWRCPSCLNVTNRRKNDSTPVRKQHEVSTIVNNTDMSIDDLLSHDESVSLVGHTISSASTEKQLQSPNITLADISMLLDQKLLKNNDTIINNIKCLIATEVQTALERLRQDFDHKKEEIVSQQEVFNNELQRTNLKIKELEKENATIKSQLRDIVLNRWLLMLPILFCGYYVQSTVNQLFLPQNKYYSKTLRLFNYSV